MKKDSINRRKFLKKTSIGAAGAVLSVSVTKSIYANITKQADTPAILGGKPVRTKRLGSSWPIYDDTDVQIYLDAFHNRRWSETGTRETSFTTQFEKKYAELMGVNYCVLTNTGTTALDSAVHAVGVCPGDEVIMSVDTFVATAQSVFNSYALAVFVDSDPETFLINADLIEERITERTRAILPVHIGGAAADMDKILAISKKYNLPVIEDACQAHMGEWRHKKLGAIGDLGCFSFQAGKSLTCGEGGAVIGDDEYLMAGCDAYQNNGRDPRRKSRFFPGSDYRMTPFQAAILLGQVRRLEEQSKIRDENAGYLEELLKDIPGISPTKKYPGQTRRSYYSYKMIYDKKYFNGLPKGKFSQAMGAEGIPISPGAGGSTAFLSKHPLVEGYLNSSRFKSIFSKERLDKYRRENHYPVNDKIYEETGLCISHRAFLGPKKDMEDIAEAIIKIQKNSSKLL